jgi:hypothetical protein
MSPASDLFSRWFSASKHGNLLSCEHGGPSVDLVYEMWITCRSLRR